MRSKKLIFLNNFDIISFSFSLDDQNNNIFWLLNNSFLYNIGSEIASVIYISNLKGSGFSNISYNNFERNFILGKTGSVIFLQSPGLISITNSNFSKNKGVMGSCIYYMEENSCKFTLLKNIFSKNTAVLGGGALFLDKDFDHSEYLQNNLFQNNYAMFGKDITTRPFAISWENRRNFPERIIPGKTPVYLSFSLLDYFGNHYLSYSSGNAAIVLDFKFVKSSKTHIIGEVVVPIINGKKKYKIKSYNLLKDPLHSKN